MEKLILPVLAFGLCLGAQAEDLAPVITSQEGARPGALILGAEPLGKDAMTLELTVIQSKEHPIEAVNVFAEPGHIPLYTALDHGASKAVIRLVEQINPAALVQTRIDGTLPTATVPMPAFESLRVEYMLSSLPLEIVGGNVIYLKAQQVHVQNFVGSPGFWISRGFKEAGDTEGCGIQACPPACDEPHEPKECHCGCCGGVHACGCICCFGDAHICCSGNGCDYFGCYAIVCP